MLRTVVPAGVCHGPWGSKSSLSVATSPFSKAANAWRTTVLFASDEETGAFASWAHAANEETSKRVRPSLRIHDNPHARYQNRATGTLPMRPRLSGQKRQTPGLALLGGRLGRVGGLTRR